MTRRRFFCESLETSRRVFLLNPEVSHHLWRVLRHRQGDSLELCDGRGQTAQATVRGYHEGRVEVEIEDFWLEEPEGVRTVLLVPWARSDRMDLVVRQAVELAVGEMWFFEAARSQYTVEGARREKRLSRYEKIARDALCQCGGAWLPELFSEDSLEAVLGRLGGAEPESGHEIRVFASEKEPRESLIRLRERYPLVQRVIAAVGPEGGWTDLERHLFQAHGFFPVNLGRRVLRFETACTALLAAIEVVWRQAFRTQPQSVSRMETP